jgi:hypothetical protein
MNFFKKIGMAILFYALGFIINANMNYLFASGGMSYIGYSIPSIIVMTVVLVAGGRMLRGERLKKNHKGDESDEKTIFNGDLKGKYSYVTKTKEFKLECILSIVFGFIAVLSPVFEYAYLYSFPVLFSSAGNVFLVLFGLLITPIYISAVNAFTWVAAYNKAYKRKAY